MTLVICHGILVVDSLQQADFLNWESNELAEKKKASSAKVTTRVVATTEDTKKPAKKTTAKPVKTSDKKVANKTQKVKKPRDNYFVGAWRELKQVRWPDRKATWSLTFAVIVYSIFFFVLVIVLDAIFKYLFDLLVKG